MVKFENTMSSSRIQVRMKTNQFLKMTHLNNFYFYIAKTGPPNLIRYGNSMTTTTKRNEHFKTGSRTELYPWIKMQENIRRGTSTTVHTLLCPILVLMLQKTIWKMGTGLERAKRMITCLGKRLKNLSKLI